MHTEIVTTLLAHGPDANSAWQGGGFHPVVPFLFLLLLAAIVLMGAMRRRRWQAGAPRRDAETALGERFARGEIEEDEFRTRRAVLREKP